ncbi:MAG: right-handed parallel beta-helix repeat-containing protein, partial [Thermoanaerobaculia bacterium]
MFKIPSRFYLCPVIAVLAAVAPGFGQTIQVPSQASLQTAIDTVADGGVIEIATGTYPATSGGFLIANPAKNFTIRAAGGATVVLDGGGTSKVLWYTAGSAATRGSVVFEGLTVRNGYSTVTGQAGGVTLTNADATFRDCIFESNTHDSESGHGGGVGVYAGSTATFVDSLWQDNVARGASAGLRVGGESTVRVYRSRFIGNRTNLPGHRPSATGGAISVVNAKLWVTDTRFEGNQAGFAGGAIYALGEYQDPVSVPHADVTAANCTFEDNHAVPDPGVSTPSPTEGGAIHSENQTRVRIFNSRL